MTSPRLTAHHLVITARALVPVAMATLGWAICSRDSGPVTAGGITLASALMVLLAAPRLRANELLAGVALFATLLEWGQAGATGEIVVLRWLACLAVPGAMMMMLKVQHLRSLARHDAYVPLRQLERRNSLLGRTIAAPTAPVRLRNTRNAA